MESLRNVWAKIVARAAILLVRAQNVRGKITAQPVLLLFAITFVVVAFLNPMKIGLLFWGICKLACFAFAGEWIDARLFKNAQPEAFSGIAQGTAWKRKAWIVCAAIVASALLP